MANKNRKWTYEKVKEMQDWQTANGKTNQETTEHFKLSSSSSYSQLKTVYLKRGNKAKRGPKKVMKRRNSISVMEIPIADISNSGGTPVDRPIAMAFIPPGQFAGFMKEFYRGDR